MRLAVLRYEEYLAPVIMHHAQAYPIWELTDEAPDSWGELVEWLSNPANREKVATALQSATPLSPPYDFIPPISPSTRIICVGLNYTDHAKETNQPLPESPVFFIRYPSSFVGHEEPVTAPKLSDKYDYEAELGIVIGRQGRYLTPANALDYVFGYTIGFDGSVRDYQKRTPQWTLGKNFDESGALGPELVSADEVPAGARGLRVQTRVNGELLQDGTTADMIFDVPTLLTALSEVMTLEPGDIILTGTPAGVGFARTPPRYLVAGDKVESIIEGLGTLRNPVIAE